MEQTLRSALRRLVESDPIAYEDAVSELWREVGAMRRMRAKEDTFPFGRVLSLAAAGHLGDGLRADDGLASAMLSCRAARANVDSVRRLELTARENQKICSFSTAAWPALEELRVEYPFVRVACDNFEKGRGLRDLWVIAPEVACVRDALGNLRSLHVHAGSFDSASLLAMKGLESLTLVGWGLHKLAVNDLHFVNLRGLRSLKICKIDGKVHCNMFTGMKQLSSLTLGEGVSVAPAALRHVTTLEHIALHTSVGPNIKFVGHLGRSLRSLSMARGLVPKLDATVAAQLTRVTFLEFLYSGCKMADVSPLKHMTALEVLYLGAHPDSGITALSSLTKLHTVSVLGPAVGDMKETAGKLGGLKNLSIRAVYTPGTGCSDILAMAPRLERLSMTANVPFPLEHMSSLAELRLCTVAACSFEVRGLCSLTRLTRLETSQNLISDRADAMTCSVTSRPWFLPFQ
jgi:hypothetical protein